jgi:hypothetical protein
MQLTSSSRTPAIFVGIHIEASWGSGPAGPANPASPYRNVAALNLVEALVTPQLSAGSSEITLPANLAWRPVGWPRPAAGCGAPVSIHSRKLPWNGPHRRRSWLRASVWQPREDTLAAAQASEGGKHSAEPMNSQELFFCASLLLRPPSDEDLSPFKNLSRSRGDGMDGLPPLSKAYSCIVDES